MFVRAGRNEVGGACFIATRQGCEISREMPSEDSGISKHNYARSECLGKHKLPGAMSGGNNEVREIYYETLRVSTKKVSDSRE